MKHDVMENWVAEEDLALLDAVRMYGTRWRAIKGKVLDGRSINSMRNRYIRLTSTATGVNRCKRCGCVRKSHICLPAGSPHPLQSITAIAHFPSTEFKPLDDTFKTMDKDFAQQNPDRDRDFSKNPDFAAQSPDLVVVHEMGFDMGVSNDVVWWPFDTSLPLHATVV